MSSLICLAKVTHRSVSSPYALWKWHHAFQCNPLSLSVLTEKCSNFAILTSLKISFCNIFNFGGDQSWLCQPSAHSPFHPSFARKSSILLSIYLKRTTSVLSMSCSYLHAVILLFLLPLFNCKFFRFNVRSNSYFNDNNVLGPSLNQRFAKWSWP